MNQQPQPPAPAPEGPQAEAPSGSENDKAFLAMTKLAKRAGQAWNYTKDMVAHALTTAPAIAAPAGWFVGLTNAFEQQQANAGERQAPSSAAKEPTAVPPPAP